MTTDYLALLREKNSDAHGVPTAKTAETPDKGTFVSFGSTPRGRIHKKNALEPLPVTQEWLETQGCNDVLQMDLAHIKKYLPVGTAARNRVLQGYVETWLAAAESEPASHRKDNAGRRAANIAIREGRL
jgi:hypothetical protein